MENDHNMKLMHNKPYPESQFYMNALFVIVLRPNEHLVMCVCIVNKTDKPAFLSEVIDITQTKARQAVKIKNL